MSYKSFEQIVECGKQPKHVKKGVAAKIMKNNRHRWLRQKNKNIDFVPQNNRYFGGWFQKYQ